MLFFLCLNFANIIRVNYIVYYERYSFKSVTLLAGIKELDKRLKYKKERKIAAYKLDIGAHYGEVDKCSRYELAERVINFPLFFFRELNMPFYERNRIKRKGPMYAFVKIVCAA